jgi:transcription elongation factor Elf1
MDRQPDEMRRGTRMRWRLPAVGAALVVALCATGLASARSTVLTGSIVRVNQTWTCTSAVNLDSVAVTITNTNKNGIVLTSGCTGTIKSISVVTNTVDGIHVNNTAHDITIGGGSITCTGRADGAHQDGIQAMSGARVTFSHVFIKCPTGTNAAFYVNWSGNTNVAPPKNILCKACYLYGTQSSTAFVGVHSSYSGLTNSTLCPSRYFTYRKPKGSTPIDLYNAYPKSC